MIEVSSDESMLLDEGDPTQRFKIGTKVGKDLAVFYSTRLDGAEQRWVGQWNPRGERFTFRAIQDSEEGQVVEASDRVSFNVYPGRKRVETKPSAQLSKLDSLRLRGNAPAARGGAAPRREAQGRAPLRPAAPGPGGRPRAGEAGRGRVPRRLGRRDGARGRRARRATSRSCCGWRRGRRSRSPGPGTTPARRSRSGPSRPGRPTPRSSPRRRPWPAPRASTSRPPRHYEAKVGHEVRATDAEATIVLTVAQGPIGPGCGRDVRGEHGAHRGGAAAHDPEAGLARVLRRARPPGPPRGPGADRLRGPRLPARARLGSPHALRPGERAARGDPPRPRGRLLARLRAPAFPTACHRPRRADRRSTLRQGEPFDVSAYLADRDKIAAWYRQEGWMEARVRGVLEVESGDVRVTLRRRPRRPAAPARGPGVVRGRKYEGTIRRAVQVRPGEVIRPQQLAETRTRLAELGTFSSVDLRTVPITGHPDLRDLEVSYILRKDVELEYGVRYDASAEHLRLGRRADRAERGEVAGGGGRAARQPLQPRLALRRLHAPDERAAELPAGARVGEPLRVAREDAAPGLRRDRRRVGDRGLVREPRRGLQHPAVEDPAVGRGQPPLARAAAAAVGLHERGHPVQRADRQLRHHRREPRLPERGPHRGRAATR